MPWEKKTTWWFGLGGIWLFALATRFWGLTRFHTLVFDEIYFARFGRHYLASHPFFDAHPPLGKYFIALGIALSGQFDPWGYRWMNALVGSLIPILGAAIAYGLSGRYRFAFFTALLFSLDGLFLVESRYALINIYLVFFGLLAQAALLWGLGQKDQGHPQGMRRRWGLLIGAIALGCCIAVKWNGLGYLLGIYSIWGTSRLLKRWLPPVPQESQQKHDLNPNFGNLGSWQGWEIGLVLPAIALGVYSLWWWPHLLQNPGTSFWQVHQQILGYHRSITDTAHPYCSPWYSWPLMLRSVGYFYQRALTLGDPIPGFGPPLPGPATVWVYDVHALFNPALIWLSTLALGIIALLGLRQLWYRHRQSEYLTIPLFIWGNYGANFLPWMIVGRCLFLYHYMPAALYSFMALAWLMDRSWQGDRPWQKGLVALGIGLIVASFIFWLPIYLGLPLTPDQFYRRMWLRSWI